ncbi:SIMPL domain-containing protein [Falsiroseomonas sp. HW251]|uniref:SIMPL domain-containing protein n=1 Tax=Falsiroseomonas sp. HW251 TaxID=3390998 RepID=UPI003D3195DC
MHRRIALLAVLALPGAALAQAPAPDTELHIGESAEVSRTPDEIVATLRAEARAANAAAAQEAVNRAITAAVARARGVPGVRVATGGYWTNRVDDNRAWIASQQLTLRGNDGAAVLELVGALQGQGMVTGGLQWTLKPETQREAREEASRLALDALRRRADAVAQQLGLQVAGLKEIRIDVPDRMPRPMAAPMAASARAASGPPPVAVAEDIAVMATVQAVVVLRPR